MTRVLKFLRLIKWQALLYAIFVMVVMRFFVIKSILDVNAFQLAMTNFGFGLLVLTVCLLIAATNILNEFYDTLFNNRYSDESLGLVGNVISRRTAKRLHAVFNIVALLILYYLCYLVKLENLFILFVLLCGILWFYSSSYKRQLIAPFIVSFLFALIPFFTVVFEIPLLNNRYSDLLISTSTNFVYILNWLVGFSCFIFANTLLYELNKSIYSVQQDWDHGLKTLPVALGVRKTVYILLILIVIVLAGILTLYVKVFSGDEYMFAYICGLSVTYILYAESLWSKHPSRKVQLNFLQFIMVLSISGAFLLNHFFQFLFAR
ncbi:hypothetical protein FACS1894199_01520 [Bacteroidia bacterium]|nr:hypothetical protein FACS1894199_01520 [Bacteroidia bacterium]